MNCSDIKYEVSSCCNPVFNKVETLVFAPPELMCNCGCFVFAKFANRQDLMCTKCGENTDIKDFKQLKE